MGLRPPDLHKLKAQRYPLTGLGLGLTVRIAMVESHAEAESQGQLLRHDWLGMQYLAPCGRTRQIA